MENEDKFARLQELKEDLNSLMNMDNSSTVSLLMTMSVALTAASEEVINTEQLLEITDSVEKMALMDTGIDRDLSFENTRKILKKMIKI
jgi:hypothetical protein|tara:strand:- start:2990 stop:3256 length:267 start_codon:yes stop_codon:yes gene_type:complete